MIFNNRPFFCHEQTFCHNISKLQSQHILSILSRHPKLLVIKTWDHKFNIVFSSVCFFAHSVPFAGSHLKNFWLENCVLKGIFYTFPAPVWLLDPKHPTNLIKNLNYLKPPFHDNLGQPKSIVLWPINTSFIIIFFACTNKFIAHHQTIISSTCNPVILSQKNNNINICPQAKVQSFHPPNTNTSIDLQHAKSWKPLSNTLQESKSRREKSNHKLGW